MGDSSPDGLLTSAEHKFERKRRGVGPRCSFCGTAEGPFREVEGLFTVLMCSSCQAVRGSSPDASGPMTQAEMTITGPDHPPELLAYHDPGQPWLKWGCPVEGCSHRVVLPWDLEGHTAAEHPDWSATWESERLRVVFRLVEGDDWRSDSSEGPP